MKNQLLSFGICILACASFFYSSAQSNQDNLLQIGTKDSVYSEILKEKSRNCANDFYL
jgi:hypothetical protein